MQAPCVAGAECRCADLTPADISQPSEPGSRPQHSFVAVSAGRYHTTAVTGALHVANAADSVMSRVCNMLVPT